VGHFPAARIITQLAYKLNGAVQVPEHYTSQTCPVCGARRRVRRIYRCPCGFEAPRDVVGLTNIRRIGLHGQMVCSPEVPRQIVYALPYRKYPGATQVVPAGSRQVARRVA
jgi:transposase